jgi:hypothetical protein
MVQFTAHNSDSFNFLGYLGKTAINNALFIFIVAIPEEIRQEQEPIAVLCPVLKSFTILIYNRNDSMIIMDDLIDSNQHYKTTILANLTWVGT